MADSSTPSSSASLDDLANKISLLNGADAAAHIAEVKDYQVTHGSLLKLVQHEEPNSVPAIPIGVSLIPTPFPSYAFKQAHQMQSLYNKLYAKVACDDTWLEAVLHPVLETDDFVRCLWTIYRQVRADGPVQDVHLGIFRSDYMLHGASFESAVIKQVEMNTFSVAGGTHSNIAAKMHRHLQRKGWYDHLYQNRKHHYTLAENQTLRGIVKALADTHHLYGNARSDVAHRTCILIIVQPFNINICDERPIEYGLWDQDIPTFRVVFWSEVLERTKLTASKELLYYERGCPNDISSDENASAHGRPWEVSLVYMRAGYEPREHSADGVDARLRLEKSRAIKCPPIAGHLVTLKRVQQALCEPGALERFVSSAEASTIRETFMPVHSLDTGKAGEQLAHDLMIGQKPPADYVMKPSLEGGGHNVFADGIPDFLKETPLAEWKKFILMEMIKPPDVTGLLMSPLDIYEGAVASELGVFGACIWCSSGRLPDPSLDVVDSRKTRGGNEIISNNSIGWSFKTKNRSVNEMSVVKGFGCFDSPLLIDSDPITQKS